MAFKRKIYDQMLQWKNEPKKNSALLIEGARRIGKTTIVQEFGKNEYSDYLYIDFTYAEKELKELFHHVNPNKPEAMNQFFADLFLLTGKAIKPGDLIIFDEIEFCSAARQDIKAFVQDGRFDFIETGSLISIRENTKDIQIPSEERRIEMHPLDFEEFCLAFNEKDKCTLLRNTLKAHSSISESIHQKQMDDFRLYLALGGMPKVISLYMETQSFLRCDKEKRDIIKLYEDDLRKHDNLCGTHCLSIYQSMFTSLHSWSQVTKTNIKNQAQRALFQRSLKDLEDSKIVNIVRRTSDPAIGDNFTDETKVKLYPLDTGLMLSQLLNEGNDTIEDAYKKIRFGKMSGANFGLLYECMVCQSLVSSGIHPNYHVFKIKENEKEKQYEIDFTYSKKGKINVLEVKSTNRFEANSINKIIEKYPHLKMRRIIISPKNLSRQNNILHLPLYMSFLIGEDNEDERMTSK